MEINLELPSHDQQKLDTESNTYMNIVDSTDGLNVNEEDLYSTTNVHLVEGCGPDENEGCTNGDVVEGSTARDGVIDKNVICEPQNGLEFETKEAAYSFYREYARSVGFGITIKASRRSKKSGKFIDVKIACARFGRKHETQTAMNPRSCVKTDCKAGLHIKRMQNEKWIIYSFIKDHNHEIRPDDFYNSIQGRNKQAGPVACQKKGLQLALEHDDIQVLLEHFMCLQAESSNFFYKLDLDHDKRLRNVFWVDAKGRHDYRFFSDVVLFDTFFIRNNYKVPYASIIGVNHHFQFILLGCALIEEKTTSTFVWLMQAWLKAAGGQAPNIIITEKEKCLDDAVAEVFPNARHCFCLWHVLSKMPENLSYSLTQDEDFKAKFNKCICRSWTEEQFEKRWWKMVEKFQLREDEWFRSLYEDRKKWVPTYMDGIFLAGMSTPERCGSLVSSFDKYIHQEATFKEFMEQYQLFLQDRSIMEAKADFETQNKPPALRSHSPFEKQMSIIYTNAIFKKFQVEVLGVVSCQVQKESDDGTTLRFRVDDFEERQCFPVAWKESTSEIHCLCRSFEYRGFLCKHAILVLQMSGVSNIPYNYILKRWTKDAKITELAAEVPKNLPYRVHRFNDLCKLAVRLTQAGSLCPEAYQIARQSLEEVFEKCVSVNNSNRNVSEPSMSTIHGVLDTEEENQSAMAKSANKRKISKTKKVHCEPEGMTISLQDSYQQLEHINPRAQATESCYLPQQDMQEMDLCSRPPNVDRFFDSQHNIQGVGQLNSIFPICDSYYSNQQGGPSVMHSMPMSVGSFGGQQSMQAMGQLCFRAPTSQGCFDIHSNLQ